MQDASPTSPAGTKLFTPVHRRTGKRLDLLITSEIDIPRGCTWRRIVKDLKSGTVYRIWNKGCGIGGCMCDAYAEEIETPTLPAIGSAATPSARTAVSWHYDKLDAAGSELSFFSKSEEHGTETIFIVDNCSEEDAHLIAAAPDLLKACRSVVLGMPEELIDRHIRNLLDNCESAIAGPKAGTATADKPIDW